MDEKKTLPFDPSASKSSIPLTTRLAIEIPKPKDWQAFQRNCVHLFRAELNDHHAKEYGRGGQNQNGIDILARRDGDPDHYVGVQCRNVGKPLRQPQILKDARATLKLKADLKELIFATTAPDDTKSSDAALEVERTLRAEGHDLRVEVYGWGQLQNLIVLHDVAYAAFHPAAVGTMANQSTTVAVDLGDIADRVTAQLFERMTSMGVIVPARETGPRDSAEEDPALHARIDTFRDLIKDDLQPLLAEKQLLSLLEKEDLSSKPWAQYRIQTLLGSVAIDLGREKEAAEHLEAAYNIRPEHPGALANLALARTIQGRCDDAMDAARAALEGSPRADHAVAYLLQAAAYAKWTGDPETLIPADLAGTVSADVGLCEFLRRRDVLGWAERSLEICRKHEHVPDFKHIKAIAVLSLAIESGDVIPGGYGPVSTSDLNEAADDLKAIAEHQLEIGFALRHDVMASVNNAALLLRICHRYEESEALLLRAMPRVGDEPQLRRLLALAQMALGKNAVALTTLVNDRDPENQLLRAEFRACAGDYSGAIADAMAVDDGEITDRLRHLRWRLAGEMALRLGTDDRLAVAVAGLRELDPQDITATVLEIRSLRKRVEDENEVRERLRTLAASAPPNLDMTSRFFLAEELSNQDLPEEASRLLDGHVDLSRPSPATSLYLQTLAGSRRDDAFESALEDAAPEVRNNAGTQWTVAAHAWNRGDLKAALAAVESILKEYPEAPNARLLKVEILVRQDRSSEVFAELEKPLENLDWRQHSDQFRVASLLGHFGFTDRAVALAYRLFLQHRDLSRAWMTLSMLVLDIGRGVEERSRRWDVTTVQSDAAVTIRFDDGTEQFFVVEPDPNLRRLDTDSWEPVHPLIKAVADLAVGARFRGPDGRQGEIKQVRHKYVDRLQYIMEHHESRFPEIFGFRSIPQSGGVDALISQVKERYAWIKQEEEQYLNGPWTLGVLAHRLGMDTIDVSAGLNFHGHRLKVALGNAVERAGADQAVRANCRKGCVLDLLAFWTCWRLGALGAVVTTCGRVHVPHSILDRLRARRERFNEHASDGLRSIGYADGKVALQEIPAELIVAQREDVDRAIAWIEANAEVLPIVANEDLPIALRQHLRTGQSDLFDSLILAVQMDLLLVTDDLPTREFGRILCDVKGTWLYPIFGVAVDWKHIDADTYIRWSAALIESGQGYLGISGAALAHAARMDGQHSEYPGPLFKALSMMIGGRSAEPSSHVVACVICLRHLWSARATMPYRQPLTGYLLRQLLRERVEDYKMLLRDLLVEVADIPDLSGYIRDWVRGHFIFNLARGDSPQ